MLKILNGGFVVKAFFVINKNKSDSKTVAVNAMKILISDGIKCIVGIDDYCEEYIDYADKAELEKSVDFIITIGGDGTFLHTASLTVDFNIPILGINLGRVGFLAALEKTELEKLHKLAKQEYFIDKRSMLLANLSSLNAGKQNNFTALNDVVVAKGPVGRTIQYSVYCDDILVSNYRGDGIVISTPTGSTAYSLSAGGPIVDAKNNAILVTPICAHNTGNPAMVFASDRIIKIAVSENESKLAYFSSDGSNNIQLDENDEITVTTAKDTVSLICFENVEQFKMIDKKLKGR